MKRILDLLGISDGFRGGKNLNLSDFIDSASIEAAIESVIDGTYPRLRLVRGYKNKLKKAVYISLTHISELVDQVPGPINASRETFVTDPGVKALFSSPAELQETFSCSDELREFFANARHTNCDNCCALLCADKEEKNVLGTELNGDSIRREVLQTTINFHDHKVLSPAETEDEVRTGIKKCIFDGLVTYALQHILAIKTARQDLEISAGFSIPGSARDNLRGMA